jgi:hypothetical protein
MSEVGWNASINAGAWSPNNGLMNSQSLYKGLILIINVI